MLERKRKSKKVVRSKLSSSRDKKMESEKGGKLKKRAKEKERLWEKGE